MRKALIGLGLLTTIGIAAPRPAHAGNFSLAIGLPGFVGIFGSPYPPPVVYAPPPPVVYNPPPVVYAPPVYYSRPAFYSQPIYYRHDNGWHRGWYKHHGHDEDDD
jgi:hypothetical protein